MITIIGLENYLKKCLDKLKTGKSSFKSSEFFSNKIFSEYLTKSLCLNRPVCKKIIKLLCDLEHYEDSLFMISRLTRSYCNSMIKYSYFNTNNLMASKIPSGIKLDIIHYSCYKDFKIFDIICDDEDLVEYGAKFCSIYKLKKLINHKNPSVREIAYDRLGPKFSFSYMLKDRRKENRSRAVRLSPMHSKDLSVLVFDRSLDIAYDVLEKCPKDLLPLFFRYRKHKGNYWKISDILDLLKKRMGKLG